MHAVLVGQASSRDGGFWYSESVRSIRWFCVATDSRASSRAGIRATEEDELRRESNCSVGACYASQVLVEPLPPPFSRSGRSTPSSAACLRVP